MKKQVIVTRESIQQMLDNADSVKRQHIVGRALIALFERQTKNEQAHNAAEVHNNIGFAGCDSKSGCITAKYYIKHRSLLDWQVEMWTRKQKNGFARIAKYAKQLNEIAIEKAALGK